MLNAIPNPFIAFTNFCRPSLILRLLLLGWLASYSTLAQAQQPSVYQELPPVPAAPLTPSAQEQLPPLPTDPQGYTTPQVNTTTPESVIEYRAEPFNQNNQNLERYLVYVDSNNFQLLQQVRSIEPGAYIRQFQGRSIIQLGVFGRQSNAQERVRQLQSYGINGARVVSLSDGQGIPNSPDRDDSRRERSNYYYVAIPANLQDLPLIQDRIRRNIGQNTGVVARNNPRGSHVAVGPFTERSQAEQWNSYLRNLGFGNARVYYGR